MPKTDKERKQKQREREAALGMKCFRMDLTANERQAIADGATWNGFDDQTEWLLSLVYAERDVSLNGVLSNSDEESK